MGLKIMKLSFYEYRLRRVCPFCFSLSIKKSGKDYKCYNCNSIFNSKLEIELMHNHNRCIDNNIDSRKERYNKVTGRVNYE